MQKLLRQTKAYVWIAFIAILFNALAPSVSQALNAARGASAMVEICTVAGRKLVAFEQGTQLAATPSATDSVLHHLEHCPYCISHIGSSTPPPASPMLFAVQGGRDIFPSLFYHSPTPLFMWSTANPRAPPAIS